MMIVQWIGNADYVVKMVTEIWWLVKINLWQDE